MLVLTRRVGEVLRIGDDIKLTVFAVQHGNQVRIGIDAPREVAVHRQEIYDRIHGQSGEAPKDEAPDATSNTPDQAPRPAPRRGPKPR